MPETIQVKPGRWRMRNGQEIDVAQRQSDTSFVWIGEGPDGFLYTWRNDGRYGLSGRDRMEDLVEFLGEPEPQVRPGRWKMRNGEVIEVEPWETKTTYKWKGTAVDGLHYTWQDDGRYLLHSGVDHPRDLVEFLGEPESEHDGWIPVDSALGGRLPTDEDERACGNTFAASWSSGRVTREMNGAQVRVGANDGVVIAWRPDPYPRPFVPPAKVEEPRERMEGYFVADAHRPHTWNGPYDVEQVSACKKPLAPQKRLRAVLPGDVDPDAARRLVEWLEKERSEPLSTDGWGNVRMDNDELGELLAACRKAGE